MKCVIVMFDSLNRHLLAPYGCGSTHTPGFARLAQRSVTFDASYVCSMPCMPARRDLHTGRPNFLHRSWGPLEPFDQSVFTVLRQEAGVYSHLCTDHYHYFEAGGATYHLPYDTWDFHRGPEGDPWVAHVGEPPPGTFSGHAIGRHAPAKRGERYPRQDLLNRTVWRDDDAKRPMSRTFRGGVDFIRRNHAADRWVLQLETFDPHEPFDAPAWARSLAAEHFDRYREAEGEHFDWPLYDYASSQATPEQVEHLKRNYAALLAACDAELNRVMDLFDELSLWDDTMLVVCTDHGFFLGERDVMGKMWVPWWDTLARTPLFVWDPRHPDAAGQRRSSLVQPMLDLGPTLCDLFELDPAEALPHATGRPLTPVIRDDMPVHDAGLFGTFGQQVSVTDGRWVYMRAPREGTPKPPEYTLMPTEMRSFFPPRKFDGGVSLAEPFNFTDGARVLRIPDSVLLGAQGTQHPDKSRDLLYDTASDPEQEHPLDNPEQEARMAGLLRRLMQQCNAPPEQYPRFALEPPEA